jgi:hypothetical protein
MTRREHASLATQACPRCRCPSQSRQEGGRRGCCYRRMRYRNRGPGLGFATAAAPKVCPGHARRQPAHRGHSKDHGTARRDRNLRRGPRLTIDPRAIDGVNVLDQAADRKTRHVSASSSRLDVEAVRFGSTCCWTDANMASMPLGVLEYSVAAIRGHYLPKQAVANTTQMESAGTASS